MVSCAVFYQGSTATTFRILWSAEEVKIVPVPRVLECLLHRFCKGSKGLRLNHPLVGLLSMQSITFQLAGHPGLQMIVDTPISGTDTRAKLTALSASGSRLQFFEAI